MREQGQLHYALWLMQFVECDKGANELIIYGGDIAYINTTTHGCVISRLAKMVNSLNVSVNSLCFSKLNNPLDVINLLHVSNHFNLSAIHWK